MTGCTSDSSRSGDVQMQTVTDMDGRQVEIPADPQRVACIYSSAAHMMAMLGEEGKIVAVPNGVKSDELMKMKIDDLEELSVPMQDNDLNVEELLDIRADLVIVKKDQIIAEGQVEKLEKAGIPWIVVDYENMDELWKSIDLMGSIFGDEEKAAEYNEFAQDTIAEVQKRIGASGTGADSDSSSGSGTGADNDSSSANGTGADSDSSSSNGAGADSSSNPDRPRIYHSVNEAIRTDEAGGICQEIMETAGVEDISAGHQLEQDGNKTYATIEEIYNWDPEGIIANESSVTEYILSDAKWAGLDAVKKGKVYTLPVGASRWCHPGSMEAHMGVLAVAWRFYPEEFSDFDINGYTKDYYSEYFGLDLDDQTVENILAGEGMRRSNDAERK